ENEPAAISESRWAIAFALTTPFDPTTPCRQGENQLRARPPDWHTHMVFRNLLDPKKYLARETAGIAADATSPVHAQVLNWLGMATFHAAQISLRTFGPLTNVQGAPAPNLRMLEPLRRNLVDCRSTTEQGL